MGDAALKYATSCRKARSIKGGGYSPAFCVLIMLNTPLYFHLSPAIIASIGVTIALAA